jgi:hypothetical protein
MSTKHIIATINVILALHIKFSTQIIHNQSGTYQWSVETNLLDFDNESNKQLMAFSESTATILLLHDEMNLSIFVPF